MTAFNSPDKVSADFDVMLADPTTSYFALGKFAWLNRVRISEALRAAGSSRIIAKPVVVSDKP